MLRVLGAPRFMAVEKLKKQKYYIKNTEIQDNKYTNSYGNNIPVDTAQNLLLTARKKYFW